MKLLGRSSLLIFLFLCSCAVQQIPGPSVRSKEPAIRVGIVWGIDGIDFSMRETTTITNFDGTFSARGVKDGKWRAEVKSSTPAQFVYRLQVASEKDRGKAVSRARSLAKKGIETTIEETGRSLTIHGRKVNDFKNYRVLLKKAYATKKVAEDVRDSIWNRLETRVISWKAKPAAGIILLKNLENGQQFESTNPIVIRNTPVTLYQIPVGVGFHWESKETRVYPENMLFQIDKDGQLAVVNVLPIENYIQGVVPSEMPPGFPLEALKAQAVAARGEVLSKLGRAHQDDPFDVCADVHCQVYSGLSKRAASTDRAVQVTRGTVLWKDGKIIEALYASMCGGHGENNEDVWGGRPVNYLRGKYDGPARLKRYGSLTREDNVARWLEDTPKAYCNTTSSALPSAMEYTRKYFRWELKYTQWEIRNIVQKKLSKDIGTILDIVPMARGKSGRIKKLKIRGSRDDIVIERELNIRKALSLNTLWSACFTVTRSAWQGGIPTEFTLKGAGFGHGVGMCQTGAGMMALKGKRYKQILQHYYRGVRFRRLY